ncbi:Uma2 family endonuclease [Nodosilinea sp. PGN35]|uniref:Uma2 family endonuclease n=1 Tax=Nodosilinea sp. PGN35 TaxID=3020489 RepID=UPI0023B21CE6|nr:Uma2 family endonuclease [Nodosilinea sp. TSF1-S3]MDF0367922.1 Uma2 family endonuclease [Nodosilinea sp. TSF1-S3]
MVVASAFSYISPEEYLAAEATSPIKHEYRDGEVYAIAGGTDAHNQIAGNLYALLRAHLQGTGCRAYFADVKARIEVLNRFYYPDVMVTCDDRDLSSSTFKRHPCLIVEVLSDSTEAFERGDKFTDYRHLESLQEYMLISQTRQQVEVFRRNAEGLWVLHPHCEGEQVSLASVGWEGAIADLYEEVIFSKPELKQSI